MTFREYRHDSDLPAVQRIWEECGWAEGEDDKAAMRHFFAVGESLVATIDDEPECVVHSTPGTVRYQDETLSLGAVTAVTTSRVARKLGFARQLTARMLARQAEQGMAVSALGMFEQGFYNLVGFGTGSYENWISFDPASLNVDVPFRPPKRLTRKDFEAMHGALLNRRGGHGQMSLLPPEFMRAELELGENGFGLGYYDGADGTLSHFIWGEAKDEHGPYTIVFHAYRNTGQLMELLSLIRSLGDQWL